ncbi:MAG TPA: von Willebrand factor type A domain-containing protein [Flavitalea sp.]|nr:von Willebrand factor type A domain-containing protein [Flavitalea sp.]
MKTAGTILLFIFSSLCSIGQYYLRGEIKDELNNPLSNAKILLHSNHYVYYSGSSGAFGILTAVSSDSVTISLEGYQSQSLRLSSSGYQVIRLKSLIAAAALRQNRLLSITKNLKEEDRQNWTRSGETYSSLFENEVINAEKYPETGFAIHTDKASYSNIRRFLNMQTTVPTDAVRPEEMLNYFNFGFIDPPGDSVFAFHSFVSDCPWNKDNRLLFLHVSARKIDPQRIPPSNLVFLIDVSGSMDMPNRLPLLKASFKLLVENLRDKDTISIVVYGSTNGVWLQPTSGCEKEKIRKSIEELEPGGSTPGESGILSAYRLAKSKFIANGNNRVILATDGDFNVGQSSEEELERLITQHQKSGIYLTCLGVGMGNYKDSKLEVLAKKGNGNFAYLDNEMEAQKVLVKELTQTLYTVADNAYLNVRFNQALVKSYRLIGYDNKIKAIADSLSQIEGGEVGSGQNMMVLFEFTPKNLVQEASNAEIANTLIHFSLPGDSITRKSAFDCQNNYRPYKELPSFYRFAGAVGMFSGLLRDSKYIRSGGFSDVLEIASTSLESSDAVQKEFIQLVEKARKIYGKKKRR